MIDRKYNVPIADAALTLYSEDRVRKGKTDKNGLFEFTGLAAKNYDLKISAPSYRTAFLPQTQISDQMPTKLSIALDFWRASSDDPKLCQPQTITPLSVPSDNISYEDRTSQTSVTGLIYDDWNHRVVSGATVSLLDTRRIDQVVTTTTSDDSGAFQFEEVKPGKYALSIIREGYYPAPPFLPFWVTKENVARIGRIGMNPSGLQDICGMVTELPLIEPQKDPIPDLIPPK